LRIKRCWWHAVPSGLLVAFPLVLFATGALAQGGGAHGSFGFLDVYAQPRVWVGGIFCLGGLGLLTKSLVRCSVRPIAVISVFFVFGVISALPLGSFARGMGLHPSPLCTITRPFQFLTAGRGIPVLFVALLAFVALFTVLGNKLFCGWVCPIGAIQELVHGLPFRKVKLPFRITNAIRVGLFIIFVAVVFPTGLSVYDYFNPFEFLHWGIEPFATFVLGVTLVAAAFIFRPFCYFMCPIGLFTWLLEHLSLVRVEVRNGRCTGCNVCVSLSPCPAVSSILERRMSRPDCHACGRCIEVCPEKTLSFRARRGPRGARVDVVAPSTGQGSGVLIG
jgi:polyferredoxin